MVCVSVWALCSNGISYWDLRHATIRI